MYVKDITMTKIKYRVTVIVFSLVAIAFGFWRVSLTKMFAESIGLSQFTTYSDIKLVGDWRVDIFPYMVLLLIAVAFVIASLAGKTGASTLEYKDIASVFCSSLCAFMMATTALFNIYFYFNGAEYTIIEWAIVCLMILSCAFFGYASSKNVQPQSTRFMFLALLPITMFLVRVMEYFFQINYRPNNATELFHLFSLCAMMMFFLEEGKFSAGNGNGKAYVFYGLSAVLLTMVYSLPHAILSAFWIINFSLESIYSCLDLVFATFIIGRIFNYELLASPKSK